MEYYSAGLWSELWIPAHEGRIESITPRDRSQRQKTTYGVIALIGSSRPAQMNLEVTTVVPSVGGGVPLLGRGHAEAFGLLQRFYLVLGGGDTDLYTCK